MISKSQVKELRDDMAAISTAMSFTEGVADTIDHLYAKVDALERVRNGAAYVAYSIAGTEGTQTNSALPEWFAFRLKELNGDLAAYAKLEEKGFKDD